MRYARVEVGLPNEVENEHGKVVGGWNYSHNITVIGSQFIEGVVA